MATILDGKALAADIQARLRDEASGLSRRPGLATVLVGENPASKVYVSSKEQDCAACGFASYGYRLAADTPESVLLDTLAELNADPKIDGILVQLPLPAHIDAGRVVDAIAPEKDVDGLHPLNAGLLSLGKPGFVPCTPAGIVTLLQAYHIPIAGKRCVILGRSNLVGRPLASLLLRENGTVTICHSYTPDLATYTQQADILIAAVGQRNLVTADMVKDGAVVVDVAMNRNEAGKLCGDVDFPAAAEKASYITPVPGGIGPMTRALLMQNVFTAAKLHSAK